MTLPQSTRRSNRLIILFVVATLSPVPLIAAGAALGGPWIWAALIWVSLFVTMLDSLVLRVTPPRPEQEFPAGTILSVVLALIQFPLLALVVWAFGHDRLDLIEKIALWGTAGIYFGQVGNANAHELIHHGNRWLHRLGMWVYISVLFGHHTSAHVLVHHRHVATPDDPNTARLGEGFYAYALRAWRGSFMMGFTAEKARLDRIGRGLWHNPYVTYVAGALLMLMAAYALGTWKSLIGFLCLAANAQGQLLLSDYVQHYGLSRKMHDNRPEPVGPRHSWNSGHWYSSAMLMNAPRHSDHHAHPGRAFATLRVPDDAPMLPQSLPVMACVALVPGAWRRVMDRRAAEWSA